MSVTIEVDIKEILNQLDRKLDKLSDDVKGLSIDMATVKGELGAFKAEVKAEIGALKDDIKDIKGTQKAQIWTLIATILAAMLGILAAFGRLVFFSANP